jgi:DUF4097 and DUF4098 domain-containing protein YvlB
MHMFMMMVALATVMPQQRTDTTFAVHPGVRLELHDVGGDVKVQAWDKPSIRISATHGSRDYLDISVSAVAVGVRARSRRGSPALVDYEIWVPAATPLDISGPQADVFVDGLTGDISAETVEGAIQVRGGNGYISLRSTEGAVTLEGARGRVQVSSVEGKITLKDVAGQVTVETNDGDITLDGVDGDDVDANTVDGAVKFRGAIKDGGRYHFATHDGDLDITVPDATNATVYVATREGNFDANFPVTVPKARKGKRFSFTMGNGSAKIELESFDGSINLTKGTATRRHE